MLVAAGAVVVIVIPMLAAIVVPTFLGQQQKAQDAAAKSLVRNAMTAIESAYIDTRDFTAVTREMLSAIEPSIAWPAAISANAGSTPAGVDASENQVAISIDDTSKYEIGTISESGTEFGVVVDKSANNATIYYKDGRAVGYW